MASQESNWASTSSLVATPFHSGLEEEPDDPRGHKKKSCLLSYDRQCYSDALPKQSNLYQK